MIVPRRLRLPIPLIEQPRRQLDSREHGRDGSSRFGAASADPGGRRRALLRSRQHGRYDRRMPDSEVVQAWIRRNEAARAEDRRRDAERSMSERLEEAIRLSRVASELEENMGREPDVRSR